MADELTTQASVITSSLCEDTALVEMADELTTQASVNTSWTESKSLMIGSSKLAQTKYNVLQVSSIQQQNVV